MQLRALALALPLLAVQSTSFAEPLEKNGLPCLLEVCLGDSLPELTKLPWAPATTPFKINNKVQATVERKLSDDDLRALKAMFPNAGDAAPYLYEKQFDATALPALSQVGAACDANELFGTFGTASGALTRVGVSLMPSPADAAKQVWTVTSIIREFPTVSTIEEKASLTAMLKRRYAKYGAGTAELPPAKPGEGRFFLGGMSNFGFGLSMVRSLDETKRMKQHPMCGAAKVG
ncbi:MAG: hypothetical protein V4484_08450 [Pseudomonadota bacterium]